MKEEAKPIVPTYYYNKQVYGPDGEIVSREEHARLMVLLKPMIDDEKAR